MIKRNHKSRGHPARVVSIVCTLLAVALLPSVAQAAALSLPPRPIVVSQSESAPPPPGGFIVLRVQFPQAWPWTKVHWQDLWTVVQWQDHSGDWHDVEGWQGTLDEVNNDKDKGVCEGEKVWWAAKADFDKGPFRWVVYRERGGKLLAQSESFYLPHFIGETVRIEVPIVP
jgi:hypothetical protein